MNVTRSAGVLLFGVLVVGVLLGALGAGAVRPRLERGGPPPMGPRGGRGPGGPGGFAAHMVEVIAPRDSVQAAAVRAVVERVAGRNRALIDQLNQSLRASVDSMRGELAPLLAADQRERLERATNQLPMVRGPGGPGGPGGRGGPGGPPRRGPPDRR